MRRSPRAAFLALAAAALAAAPARADSIFWTGPTSANWTNPSSWSSGTTPGALDDVTLGLLPAPNQGNAYTVTVNSPQAANSLTINAGTATLLSNLGAGNTFTVGTVNLSAGAFNQTSGVLNVGTLNVTGGTFTLGVVSFGTPANTSVVTLGAGGGTVGGTGTFAFSAGTLNGSALTVNNAGFTWDNGVLQTAVNLNAGGALIDTLGTKNLDNGAQLNLNGGTTTFVGTLKYVGAGSVTIASGATLSIRADVGVTKDSAYAGSAPFTINAGGTLVKALGSGTASFQAGLTVTNAGTIRSSSATLQFDSGMTNSGTLQADAGAEVKFSTGTFTLNAGSAITGAGTFHLRGGSATSALLDLQADTAADAATTVYLDVGTVQGTRTLTVNGPLNWGTAVIGGSATVKALGGGTVSSSTINPATVSSGTMNLAAGSFNWTTGNMVFAGNGTLLVSAGATLTDNGNHAFIYSSGTPTIQNNGTLEKTSGTGASPIPAGITLNSAGTLRVTAGSWNINGGVVNNTGTLEIGPGTEVFVNGGTLVLGPGTLMPGTGNIRIDSLGGTPLTVNGNVNSAGGLTLVRGQVNGSGTLTLAGPFNFGLYTGTPLTGLTINAAGGGDWTSTGTALIGAAAVNITGGTVPWNTSDIVFTTSGSLSVGAGATLDLQGPKGFTVQAGSPSLTVNGTFVRSAGTGNTLIPATLAVSIGGTGLLDVESGTVTLRTSPTNNGTIKVGGTGTLILDQPVTIGGAGTVNVTSSGTLTVGPGGTNTAQVSSGTFTDAGVVSVTSGTFKLGAGVNLANYAAGTLSGGTWKATNGTLNLDGRAVGTIAAGTTVELSGSSAAVTGLTSLTQNNGQLRIYNSATLTPPATVNNAGTLEVTGTLGTAVVVQSGGVLTGKGTVNGSVTVQSGGTVVPGPGPYAANGPGVLTAGNVALNGGSAYVWEVNSWSSATAGTNFDQIKGVSGAKLNLSGASAANPVVLRITSLNGSSPGQIPTFDGTQGRSWVIADFSNGNATGGVLAFSPDKVTLDTSAFFNSLGTGVFYLSTDASSNQLILNFSPVPVPEPGLAVLVGAAALAVVRRRR